MSTKKKVVTQILCSGLAESFLQTNTILLTYGLKINNLVKLFRGYHLQAHTWKMCYVKRAHHRTLLETVTLIYLLHAVRGFRKSKNNQEWGIQ